MFFSWQICKTINFVHGKVIIWTAFHRREAACLLAVKPLQKIQLAGGSLQNGKMYSDDFVCIVFRQLEGIVMMPFLSQLFLVTFCNNTGVCSAHWLFSGSQ